MLISRAVLAISLVTPLALGGCSLLVHPDSSDLSDTTSDPSTGDGAGDGASDGADGDGAAGCAVTLCKQGTTCVETDQGAVCVADGAATCETRTCPEGTTCVDKTTGAECVPETTDPCATVDCANGCEVQNGEAVCLPPPVRTCADLTCPEGQHCEELDPPCAPPDDGAVPPACDPVPTCVADLTCADVNCIDGYYCDESSGQPVCVAEPSCDGYSCDDGQVCALQQVDCVTEPCFPQPTCAPDPCQFIRCRFGQHCEPNDDVCGNPCFIGGSCVDD